MTLRILAPIAALAILSAWAIIRETIKLVNEMTDAEMDS